MAGGLNRHEVPASSVLDRHLAQFGHGLPTILPALPVSTIGGEPVRVVQRVTDDTLVMWTKSLDIGAE